jgi:pimeloyl-ACP methyl ester carboxylesterase
VLLVAGAGVTVGGLAACGGDSGNDRAAKVDPTAPVAIECPGEEVPPGMERLVVQGDDGTPIGTATVGAGPTAVVLVHGSGQDLCDWLWFVPRLVDLGVTVVPYDLRGRGSSSGAKGAVEPLPGDLAAVVDAARAGGAERVVLVGTSLGAATALVAAGRIEPPVDAVVAVSPPSRLGGVAVADAATSYDGPVYLVVARDDDGYPATVRDLAAALPGATTPIVLDGSDHGLRLVRARPDDVASAIEQSVRDAGGP